MPPGTLELRRRLDALPYTLVRMGNCIYAKRKQHNLRTFLLSICACLLCMDTMASFGHFSLVWIFEEQLGSTVTLFMLPLWAAWITLKVPEYFLLEPLNTHEHTHNRGPDKADAEDSARQERAPE